MSLIGKSFSTEVLKGASQYAPRASLKLKSGESAKLILPKKNALDVYIVKNDKILSEEHFVEKNKMGFNQILSIKLDQIQSSIERGVDAAFEFFNQTKLIP